MEKEDDVQHHLISPYGYAIIYLLEDTNDYLDLLLHNDKYESDIIFSPQLASDCSSFKETNTNDNWVLRDVVVEGPINGSMVPSFYSYITYIMFTED